MDLYHIEGYRYEHRNSVIQRWIERDRRIDEKLENVQEPQHIICPRCSHDLEVKFKDLYDMDTLRILFLLECPNCKKREIIFDNGTEFVSTPEVCPKCRKEIKVSFTQEGRVLKWKKHCKACGFKEIEIDDLDKDKAERLKKEADEKALLRKYRNKFCLSDKEGQEYIEYNRRLKMLVELLQKFEHKKTDPDCQKLAKLKRLTIVELEKMVTETIEKEKYIKLMLEKPDIDRFVIVPFTAQDADSARKENASICKLNRIIKKVLEGTNWRLMSEGVHYRLGYLSGKLKGYEREEDLLELVRRVKKKKTSSGKRDNQGIILGVDNGKPKG